MMDDYWDDGETWHDKTSEERMDGRLCNVQCELRRCVSFFVSDCEK